MLAIELEIFSRPGLVEKKGCAWRSNLTGDEFLTATVLGLRMRIDASFSGGRIDASISYLKGILYLEKDEEGDHPNGTRALFIAPTETFLSGGVSRLIAATSRHAGLSPSQVQQYIDDFITPKAVFQSPTPEVE